MSARLFLPILLAVAVSPSLLRAAPEEVRKAGKAVPSKGNDELEVLKPEEFSTQELRVLRSLDTLSVERLTQLLLVYERLGNQAMLDALLSTLKRRDPDNAEARRISESGNDAETTRPAGYLEELTRQVMAGKKVDDADSVPVQAVSLITDGRYKEAIALLEKLRDNQFKATTFPYLDDLAYAYTEAGRLDDAENAYRKVLIDPRMPAQAKAEANAALPHVLIKKRIAAIKSRSGTDMERMAEESRRLYAEMPQDPDVLSFRVDSLMMARKHNEAIALLLHLRDTSKDEEPWPWLPTLGFCYYGAREYDKAIAIFREVHKNDAFDAVSRMESETMILEIQVGRHIESGSYALERGDLKTAEAELQLLERDYGDHRDVAGYKAIILAKTGHGDEALAVLKTQQNKERGSSDIFSQQDALADVYVELKRYPEARAANAVILDDPRYDEEMRIQAIKRVEDIYIAEALDAAYLAIRDGHRARANAIAADVASKAPHRIEGRLLNAEVGLAYFQAEFARDELLAVKNAGYYRGMPFPEQNTLAAALAQTGDWQGAAEAYEQVLNASPLSYEAEDRWDALWEHRRLLSWFRPNLESMSHGVTEDEGSALHSEYSYQTAWMDNWRFTAFARTHYTALKRGGLLGRRTDFQAEGGIKAMRLFPGDYYAEAMIGASESDPIYAFHVGKLAYRGIGWSLGFTGNALSNDSVNLQALNGRENRAEFAIHGPLTDRWNFDLEGYYQWVHVGGSRLGEGYGASGSLDYTLQTETRKRWEVSIGYFFDYSRFKHAGTLPPRVRSEVRRAGVLETETRRALASDEEFRRAVPASFGNEIFDSLADPYTNRHGIMIKARKHFENHLALSVELGAFYSIDDRSAGWTAGAAAEYWLNDRTMLYGEIRYESAGKGASDNAGVWEANIGGQMTF